MTERRTTSSYWQITFRMTKARIHFNLEVRSGAAKRMYQMEVLLKDCSASLELLPETVLQISCSEHLFCLSRLKATRLETSAAHPGLCSLRMRTAYAGTSQ